jgi:hypothetical protein
MTTVQKILSMLAKCSPAQREEVFRHLRRDVVLHPLESDLHTRAEVILEAIHRSGGLTLRMIRGVIAQAAFEIEILERLKGWKSIACSGDHPYDFLIRDKKGDVRLQVKLQRSKDGTPMWASQANQFFSPEMYVVETQKTRRGNKRKTDLETRPYRFGEFDILVVSMYPSTQRWDSFMFTVANWLLPSLTANDEIHKFQPVSVKPSEYWTDDLGTAIGWFRSGKQQTIPGELRGK